MGCCANSRLDKLEDDDKPRPSARPSLSKKTSADLPTFTEWRRLEEQKKLAQPPSTATSQSPQDQSQISEPAAPPTPASGSTTPKGKPQASKKELLKDSLKEDEEPKASATSFLRPQGLQNLGNTCYMNSVLQCLCRAPGFFDLLEANKRDQVVERLARLLRSYHTRENVTGELADFRRVLTSRLSRFRGGEQQDAKDLLMELTSYLEKVNRPAAELFYGKRADKITCLKCKTQIQAEAELFLVPLERQRSLDVGNFLAHDDEFMLTGENKLKCAHCKTACEARVVTKIVKAPQVLVVYIEPFDMRGKRIKQSISVSERVTLLGRRYALFGLVAHHGSSIHSGHFTAHVKYSRWYQCDDSRVTATEVAWSQAYLLFYEADS